MGPLTRAVLESMLSSSKRKAGRTVQTIGIAVILHFVPEEVCAVGRVVIGIRSDRIVISLVGALSLFPSDIELQPKYYVIVIVRNSLLIITIG